MRKRFDEELKQMDTDLIEMGRLLELAMSKIIKLFTNVREEDVVEIKKH